MRNTYNSRYILNVALEHKAALIKANIIAILATLCAVPIPLLMPLMVDEVLLNQPGFIVNTINQTLPEFWHQPMRYLVVVLIITMTLRLLSLVFNVWQTWQFTIIAKEITYRIRHSLLDRLQRISMSEYETLGSGAVSSHLVTDLNTIDNFVGTSVSRLLVAVLSIIGTAVILLIMHWQLALFILLLNPVVIYATVIIGKKVKTLKQRENKAFEVFQSSLTETLEGIQQVRAANREEHYLKHLSDQAKLVRDHGIAYAWKSDTANRLSFTVFLLGFEVFRASAMMMVLMSDLSIGQMMAVFSYLWFMMGPVNEVIGIQYAWYAAKAALGRINELDNLEQEPVYDTVENPFLGQHTVAISIEDLYFRYGDNEDVLKGVSLDIKAGEKVALVGASGGGKSTLVQVLLGLYPHQSGQLKFNGVPVEKIGLQTVRQNISTVLQHPVIFNGSIRENLTMGKDMLEEDIWHVLDIAQMLDFVWELEDDLDTEIGRSGVRLSGGQRQRLAIARMILANPKVVILDEATSALDMETEQNLLVALDAFLEERTTIIIAHRFSAVRQADRVYVFEDGKISEQGHHDELINSGGLYTRLYSEAY
ncbi:MAG: ABC transporter ATP-binding protein [Piscirickettsiaceae bacterium]|nr:ABC transporter ATP-binding protein [Piscirickettsiaceae bacterium]